MHCVCCVPRVAISQKKKGPYYTLYYYPIVLHTMSRCKDRRSSFGTQQAFLPHRQRKRDQRLRTGQCEIGSFEIQIGRSLVSLPLLSSLRSRPPASPSALNLKAERRSFLPSLSPFVGAARRTFPYSKGGNAKGLEESILRRM